MVLTNFNQKGDGCDGNILLSIRSAIKLSFTLNAVHNRHKSYFVHIFTTRIFVYSTMVTLDKHAPN